MSKQIFDCSTLPLLLRLLRPRLQLLLPGSSVESVSASVSVSVLQSVLESQFVLHPETFFFSSCQVFHAGRVLLLLLHRQQQLQLQHQQQQQLQQQQQQQQHLKSCVCSYINAHPQPETCARSCTVPLLLLFRRFVCQTFVRKIDVSKCMPTFKTAKRNCFNPSTTKCCQQQHI
ncbi:hypothetical protein ACLKA7_010083 [Drosophila subpalustris]